MAWPLRAIFFMNSIELVSIVGCNGNVGMGEGQFDGRPDRHREIGDREGKFGAIGKPKRMAPGQRMLRRHDGAEGEIVAGDNAQPRAVGRIIGQRQVGFAGQNGVGHLVERQHPHAQKDARMLVEHAAEKSRQRTGGESVHGRDRRPRRGQVP